MSIISENAKRIATANKKLGQNFILDMNITNKIAGFATISSADTVIEIGPGPGGLTLAILEKQPQDLILIEKDERCLSGLQDLIETYGRKTTVHIVHDDALFCFPKLVSHNDKIIIVANLPYNIASPLLIQFIHCHQRIKEMVLMFQKEVAERITASPGSKHYGRLSIITQIFFKPTIVYNLPPSVFTPPPKVDSSVVHFVPANDPGKIDLKNLEYVTHIFFSNRRKTIGHIIKKHFKNNPEIFDILNPYLQLRPENLYLETYIQVAQIIKN